MIRGWARSPRKILSKSSGAILRWNIKWIGLLWWGKGSHFSNQTGEMTHMMTPTENLKKSSIFSISLKCRRKSLLPPFQTNISHLIGHQGCAQEVLLKSHSGDRTHPLIPRLTPTKNCKNKKGSFSVFRSYSLGNPPLASIDQHIPFLIVWVREVKVK